MQNNVSPMQANLNCTLLSAVKLLGQAHHVCILTGAGISAKSGIPTFRDKQTGLWENYRAEDLANVDAFQRDPKLVWSWYQWRRHLVKDKQPNSAHYALANWQQYATHLNQNIFLITQNVDDLHEQANSKAIHLHGHLWKNKCSHCDHPYLGKINDNDSHLIRCPKCNGYIRPDIVWFGEALPIKAWQDAEQAASHCDVFISIGTSSVVYPAAGLASLAKQNHAKLIEINPNPTNNPIIDIILPASAGTVLPKLVNKLLSSHKLP